MNFLKIIGIVWILGAFFGTVHDEYRQKRECIELEGFWKGWLYCSIEPQNPYVGYTALMVKNLTWPWRIFNSDKPASKDRDSNLDGLIDTMNKCKYDHTHPTTESLECMKKTIINETGAKDAQQAQCTKLADTYQKFAKVRDSGLTLDASLNELDKLGKVAQEKIRNSTGQIFDLSGAKKIMITVYDHKEITPDKFYDLSYSACG